MTKKVECSQIGIFLIKTIYFVGVIHSIIMMLSFFIPTFREILYSFIFLGENGKEFVELNQRSPGLTSSGGDSLSVFQSTAFVFGIYYVIYYIKEISLLRLVIHLCFFVLLLFSILLSARTGLILLILGISLLLTFKLCSFLYTFRFIKSTVKKSIVILLLMTIFIVLIYNIFIDSDYTRFTKRAFEIFTTYEQRGNLGTTSTDKLREMYFLPNNERQLIYGNGNFGRDTSLELIESDVGYVRILFGSGAIGMVLFYLPIILIYLVLIKTTIKQNLFLPFTYVILMILVVNFKVLHLYSLNFGFKIFILLTSIIIYTNYFIKK
ncbi:hypothetical protein ACNO6Z_06770 [Aliarcobacter lanthieri]|uniref:hypothetical protein n=1 Tax=Aliarcobacter lanthieri TaxID=1355374 RepID=UPI003AA901A6